LKVEAKQIMINKVNNQREKVICPKFEHTFMILGKKWNGLIIDVLLEGPSRFKDIASCIDGVSDRVLVERLKELEKEDIITKEMDETCDISSGYRLTTKGYGLKDVMDEVQAWSDNWVCEEDLEKAE